MNASEQNEEKARKQRTKTGWSYWIASRPLALGGEAQVCHWWEWEQNRHGKRVRKHKRKQFSDEAALKVWLQTETTRRSRETTLIRRHERGGGNVVTLAGMTPAERAAVAAAVAAIRGAGGKPEAIADAARIYAKNQLEGAKMTVAELLDEHLEALTRQGKRWPTIRDRRLYLAPFVEAYGDSLAAALTTAQAEDWVYEADTPSKQASRRRALHALYNFALKREYIDRNPVHKVEEPREPGPDRVHVFTPQEAEAVLRAAQIMEPRMAAYFAVGMLAGLRPQNELAQLDWQDISLTNGLLTVTRTTSKTRRTRNVPIQPNLAAWLRSVPKSERTGKLFYSRRWMRRIVAAAKLDAKGRPAPFKMQEGKPIFERGAKLKAVKWGADVMRHSYCSYRNAVIKNIPQLCLEAGNTPDIAKSHYLNPRVTPAQVKAFWSIRPTSVTEKKEEE